MLWVVFIALAASCNAIMDAVENENFWESIMRDWKRSFWYKRESWKTAPRIFGYHLDAWHLFKTAMIGCWTAALLTYPTHHIMLWGMSNFLVDAGIAVLTWNAAFILVYNKILKVK